MKLLLSSGHSYRLGAAVLFFVLVLQLPASGQLLPPPANVRHRLGLAIGFDHNILALRLGYGRFLPAAGVAFGIEAAQGTSLLGSANFSTRATVTKWWPVSPQFYLYTLAGVTFTSAENVAATLRSLGYTLEFAPAYRRKKMALGLQVALTSHFATRVVHSDYARKFLFAEAEDGWYRSTGHVLRVGGLVTHALGRENRSELTLYGGYQTSGRYDRLLPKLYFNLQFSQYLR